ncbi:hypothetical protein E4U55_004768 [Claviceps digitariae]|nr:hypothetical protein E4U55_004768 [Claviceps digitariae]
MFCTRCIRASAIRHRLPLPRKFHTSTPLRTAADAAAEGSAVPEPSTKRSICVEGTVLTGLNYLKGGHDPVAKKDEEYPEWLWSCLNVMKKANAAQEDAGDEFSKSKKQRQIAAKRQKTTEARLIAEGNLEALAPKIPIQQQSINLPGEEGGSMLDAIAAAEKRQELKRAMRKERKAKIKEDNYLKSM